MHSVFKRAVWLAPTGFLWLAFVAGCSTSRQAPANESRAPAAVAKTSPATPPAAIPAPSVSRPRPPAASADNMAPNLLAWDTVSKEYRARPGQTAAPFTFDLTNVSPESIVIFDTSTTCDCTVAKLPSQPWVLPPGGTGQIHATLNFEGRTGQVTNYIIVFTSKGNRLLTVRADVPKESPAAN